MLRTLVFALSLIATSPAHAQAPSAEQILAEYEKATRLFQAGQQDEAVYWYYHGQLRFRIYLRAHPELPPDTGPALFASLSEVVGRPLNEYAFGDVPALAATIGRVLAWEAANDDPVTPKARYGAPHREITAGLRQLQTQILAEQDSIRRTRTEHGLANRR